MASKPYSQTSFANYANSGIFRARQAGKAMINPSPRRNKKAAAMAVEYVIEHKSVTYRQAAKMFGVTINQIKTRINHRYGSRGEAIMLKDYRERHWGRPCICCGDTEQRPYGQYRCDRCLGEAGKIHDGVL